MAITGEDSPGTGGFMSYASDVLTVTEWVNLLSALKTVIERYGLQNVHDAVQHIMIAG